jgi:drug/metabolite transporter (DMT)-like permease
VIVASWLWAVFTLIAAGAQTVRNAAQRELTAKLGTVGATHIRFLFGCPFALALLAALVAGGIALPRFGGLFWSWVVFGALTQIIATALMLAAMEQRSFVVATAYVKTEPVQVAVFGLIFLGDPVTPMMAAAIVIATAGVVVTSLRPGRSGPSGLATPKSGNALPGFSRGAPGALAGSAASMRPMLLGIAAGTCFALSVTGFRGAILSLADPDYLMAASFTLAAGLAVQTVLLTFYLGRREAAVLKAILAAWRPSLFAGFMGALASQFWFLAFALASAASVRTLALVEVLFAQAISHFVFKQPVSKGEGIGVAAIVIGVVLLIWAY